MNGAITMNRIPGILCFAVAAACSDSSGPEQPADTRVAAVSFAGPDVKIFDGDGVTRASFSCGAQCRIRTVEWSRNGDMLAMTANTGTASALIVANYDGSGMHELARVPAAVLPGPKGSTQLLFHDFQPDWSSNDRIVYVANGLIVSAADGSGKRVLLAANVRTPQWAPKDSAVTYIDGTSFQLGVVRSDGTAAHQLSTLPGTVTGQVWSPDGSSLAISTNVAADGGLYMMDARTAAMREIARVSYGDSHCWSRDSRSLTFIRAERAPVSNNEVTTAAIANADNWAVRSLAATPVYRTNRAAPAADGGSVFFFGFDSTLQEDALYVSGTAVGEARRFASDKGIKYFSVSGTRCSYLFNVI